MGVFLVLEASRPNGSDLPSWSGFGIASQAGLDGSRYRAAVLKERGRSWKQGRPFSHAILSAAPDISLCVFRQIAHQSRNKAQKYLGIFASGGKSPRQNGGDKSRVAI